MSLSFSIVVPTYNNADYVEECIDSLLRQGDCVKEIIVVDDGSVDRTHAILKKISERYEKVTVVRTENKGVSHARNIGASMASGDYISFVDSDDYVDDGSFEYFNKLLSENGGIDALRYNFIEFGGKRYDNNLFDLGGRLLTTDKEKAELKKHLLTNEQPVPNLCQLLVIKKIIARKIKFNEDISFLEDAVYYQDLIDSCNEILILDEKAYRLRTFDNSSSRASSRTLINLASLAKANNKLRSRVPDLLCEIDKNHLKLFVNKLSYSSLKDLGEMFDELSKNKDVVLFLNRVKKENLNLVDRAILRSLKGNRLFAKTFLVYKKIGRKIKRGIL